MIEIQTQLPRPHIGGITINNAGAQFLRDEQGWLRRWEPPAVGRSYLVVLMGRTVSVWRQECSFHEVLKPVSMVAACVHEQSHHTTILTDWAHDLSKHYGDCLTMLDIATCPGSARYLSEKGVPLWFRQQRDEKRPVGQSKPTRHIGWEMTETNKLDAMFRLQRLISDEELLTACPQMLMEFEAMIQGESGKLGIADWTPGQWLLNAAMAVVGLPSAVPMAGPRHLQNALDYRMGGDNHAAAEEHPSQNSAGMWQ